MYSSFFQTLYDELRPVGNLGRGTHYSVLRAATWHDTRLRPLKKSALLDFAVVWDEDHDTRVIEVIHELYFDGLLAPIRFIGERKGGLSVLIAPEVVAEWRESDLVQYSERIEERVVQCSEKLGDSWPVSVDSVSGDHSIISADRVHIEIYLRCIQMLWNLGLKPRSIESRALGELPQINGK